MPDPITKVDIKRLARKVLGPKARVWRVGKRCCLGVELPGPDGKSPRVVIASADTWRGLVDAAFVQPLEALEKAKEAGFDVKSIRQAVREAGGTRALPEGPQAGALPEGPSVSALGAPRHSSPPAVLPDASGGDGAGGGEPPAT
jgi:hypothetical protein